jgi:hypothetical protein
MKNKNYWEEVKEERKKPLTKTQQIFVDNGFSYGEKGDLLRTPPRKKFEEDER